MVGVALSAALLAVLSATYPGRDRQARRAGPVRDYSLPDSGDILNLVFTDWFTNPRHREEALSLLNDIPSEPSGTPRPRLRRVILDSRTMPEGYVPGVPGTPVTLCGTGKLVEKGELVASVFRFEPRPDGVVHVEFSEGNYGYTGNWVVYRAKEVSGRWALEFVRSNWSE
jgi:hypothetical protein